MQVQFILFAICFNVVCILSLDLSFYMFAISFWIRRMVKVEKNPTTTSILKRREYHFRRDWVSTLHNVALQKLSWGNSKKNNDIRKKEKNWWLTDGGRVACLTCWNFLYLIYHDFEKNIVRHKFSKNIHLAPWPTTSGTGAARSGPLAVTSRATALSPRRRGPRR
jgi:hypothetical protein